MSYLVQLNLKASNGLRDWTCIFFGVANFNGFDQFQYVVNFPLTL